MNSNEHWKLQPGNSVLKRLEWIWPEGEELQSHGGLWHVPSCVLCSDTHLVPDTDWEGTDWHGPKLCQDTCTEVTCALIYMENTGGHGEPCWPTTPANSGGREGSLGSMSAANHTEAGTSTSLGYQHLLCAHKTEDRHGYSCPRLAMGWHCGQRTGTVPSQHGGLLSGSICTPRTHEGAMLIPTPSTPSPP